VHGPVPNGGARVGGDNRYTGKRGASISANEPGWRGRIYDPARELEVNIRPRDKRR
jgi:hypothetical protein